MPVIETLKLLLIFFHNWKKRSSSLSVSSVDLGLFVTYFLLIIGNKLMLTANTPKKRHNHFSAKASPVRAKAPVAQIMSDGTNGKACEAGR